MGWWLLVWYQTSPCWQQNNKQTPSISFYFFIVLFWLLTYITLAQPVKWCKNIISVCIDTFSSSIVGTLYHLKVSLFKLNQCLIKDGVFSLKRAAKNDHRFLVKRLESGYVFYIIKHATPRNKWSVCWSSSLITYLSPLEGHCFSRSSAYQWVRIYELVNNDPCYNWDIRSVSSCLCLWHRRVYIRTCQ
jgi:hypothetical protein